MTLQREELFRLEGQFPPHFDFEHGSCGVNGQQRLLQKVGCMDVQYGCRPPRFNPWEACLKVVGCQLCDNALDALLPSLRNAVENRAFQTKPSGPREVGKSCAQFRQSAGGLCGKLNLDVAERAERTFHFVRRFRREARKWASLADPSNSSSWARELEKDAIAGGPSLAGVGERSRRERLSPKLDRHASFYPRQRPTANRSPNKRRS